MKYFRITFLISILFTTQVAAQALWVYRYNGSGNAADAASSIAYGADGSIYVAGYSTSSGSVKEFTVISLHPAGDTNWVYRCHSSEIYYNRANAVIYGGDGNIYAAGRIGFDNFVVVSLTSAGDTNWIYSNTSSGECEALSLTYGADGNIYAAGHIHVPGEEWNYTVISINQAGTANWVITIDGGSNQYDNAYSVFYGADGKIYTAGYRINAWFENNFTVFCHNRSNGWINWNDYWTLGLAHVIIYGGDNNIYVAGLKRNSQFGPSDILIRKYNSAGSTQWSRIYNGSNNENDYALSIVYGDDGNIYTAGYTNNVGTGGDFTVISLTPANNLNWVFQYGDSGSSSANSIVYGSDGKIYCGGYETNNYNNKDFLIVCLSTNGDTNWVYRYDGPGSGDDIINSMVYSGEHRLYAAGYSTGSGTNKDFTVTCINTLGLEENTSRPLQVSRPITITPNPCSKEMKITLSLPEDGEPISLYLFDVTGRLVETVCFNRILVSQSFTHYLSVGIATGIYYLILETKGEKYTQKVTIIH